MMPWSMTSDAEKSDDQVEFWWARERKRAMFSRVPSFTAETRVLAMNSERSSAGICVNAFVDSAAMRVCSR